MGASTFIVHTKPYANAREAFNDAIRDAAWEHGHGGYTGTIAEKSNFFQNTAESSTGNRPHKLEGN